MKIIQYKMDLRLNPQDEYPVVCDFMIPYSEENLEWVKENSVDGMYFIEEDEQSETTDIPTMSERISAIESAFLELLGVTENG